MPNGTDKQVVKGQADGGAGALVCFPEGSEVVLDFGARKLSFVRFSPNEARRLAMALMTAASKLDGRLVG